MRRKDSSLRRVDKQLLLNHLRRLPGEFIRGGRATRPCGQNRKAADLAIRGLFWKTLFGRFSGLRLFLLRRRLGLRTLGLRALRPGAVGLGLLFLVLLAARIARIPVRGRGRSRGGLLGVVSDVPARAFELHGGRRHDLLDLAAAVGTLLHMRIGIFLDPLKTMMAFLALVFVKWH